MFMDVKSVSMNFEPTYLELKELKARGRGCLSKAKSCKDYKEIECKAQAILCHVHWCGVLCDAARNVLAHCVEGRHQS